MLNDSSLGSNVHHALFALRPEPDICARHKQTNLLYISRHLDVLVALLVLTHFCTRAGPVPVAIAYPDECICSFL